MSENKNEINPKASENNQNEESFLPSASLLNHQNLINLNQILPYQNEMKVEQKIKPRCPNCSKISALFKDKSSTKRFQICSCCENNHLLKDLSYNDYYMKSISQENRKLTCDICKEELKLGNIIFYFCSICQQNVCEKCEKKHSEKFANLHNLILIEHLDFLCSKHLEKFSNFCQDCKKNICLQCAVDHKNHNCINFQDILPTRDDLKGINDNINYERQELNFLRIKFDEWIEEMRKKFYELVENGYQKLNLFEKIVDNFDLKELNYQMIHNIRFIMQNQQEQNTFINESLNLKNLLENNIDEISKFNVKGNFFMRIINPDKDDNINNNNNFIENRENIRNVNDNMMLNDINNNQTMNIKNSVNYLPINKVTEEIMRTKAYETSNEQNMNESSQDYSLFQSSFLQDCNIINYANNNKNEFNCINQSQNPNIFKQYMQNQIKNPYLVSNQQNNRLANLCQNKIIYNQMKQISPSDSCNIFKILGKKSKDKLELKSRVSCITQLKNCHSDKIAIGLENGTIRIYYVYPDYNFSLSIFADIKIHNDRITCLTPLKNGNLISCSIDGKMEVIGLTKNYLMSFITTYGVIQNLNLLSDSNHVCTCLELYNDNLISGDWRHILIWKNMSTNSNSIKYVIQQDIQCNSRVTSLVEIDSSKFASLHFGEACVKFYYSNDGGHIKTIKGVKICDDSVYARDFMILGDLNEKNKDKDKDKGNDINFNNTEDKYLIVGGYQFIYLINTRFMIIYDKIKVPNNDSISCIINSNIFGLGNSIIIGGKFNGSYCIRQYKINLNEYAKVINFDEIGNLQNSNNGNINRFIKYVKINKNNMNLEEKNEAIYVVSEDETLTTY